MFEDYDIFDRKRLSLHCLITLLSPMSHIGEVTGNISNLKTLKVIDLEGNPRSIFVLSGNSLRNRILRRFGTAAFLESLELTVNPDVHHTLFAGGRIDGSTGSDMDLDRRMRQLLPPISVLGTAKPAKVFGTKDAQMVQGRLSVGSAYLVCYESAEYLYGQFPSVLPPESLEGIEAIASAKSQLSADPFTPASSDAIALFTEAKAQYIPYLRKVLRSWTEFVCVDQTTRRDSTQDPELRKFLPPPEQLQLPGMGSEKQKKSDQMISGDRLIMAGAKLYSRWDFFGTEVELGWMVEALLRFGQSPYLGGRSSRGNGLVSMDFWFRTTEEKGHFLSFGNGQQMLNDYANVAHAKYQEYLSVYREYLEGAKDSQELKTLLGASV